MSFGESKYPFGDQNPTKPLAGLGAALGKVMDAHRDRKNTQIEAEGKAAGAALQTHLNLEAGMIDREHMVHVFGEQLKPHLKPGTTVSYQSGNHSIGGTWAGGDEAANGEADGEAKPADGEAKPKTPAKPRTPRGPRAPKVTTHFTADGKKVTGRSVEGHTDTFPTPVNVQPSAGSKKPAATTTKPAGGTRKPAGSTTGGTRKPPAAKPATVGKPKTAAQLAQKPAVAKRPQPKK
jgi:hypothetical protein